MILCTNCLRRTKKYIILHWHGSAVSCFRHFSYAILYLFDLKAFTLCVRYEVAWSPCDGGLPVALQGYFMRHKPKLEIGVPLGLFP